MAKVLQRRMPNCGMATTEQATEARHEVTRSPPQLGGTVAEFTPAPMYNNSNQTERNKT
jgi:hypothetical protein